MLCSSVGMIDICKGIVAKSIQIEMRRDSTVNNGQIISSLAPQGSYYALHVSDAGASQ